jgi:hypothetical protein
MRQFLISAHFASTVDVVSIVVVVISEFADD